jgi:hypothetical protein
MNPDVFITIAFAALPHLVALVFGAFVVPQIRREGAALQRRESRGRDAAVH